MRKVRQMTDAQLGAETRRARKGWQTGMLMLGAGTALGFLGAVIATGITVVGLGMATVGIITAGISSLREDTCKTEAGARRMDGVARRRLANGGKSAPAPAHAADAFNPAAATVLETDIRPMAPLRLKSRSPAFVTG